MTKKVTAIIPVYNEERDLANCLSSLKKQTYKDIEIIVVDDGSTDSSKTIAKKLGVKILHQKHQGPGTARNLGASCSKGEILVFVDADMTFDENFISDLVKPISEKKAIGTFSKNEIVTNKDNIWSICWNVNRNAPRDKMLPENYPNEAPVYRAILKSEFQKVGGFETSGDYTDDWSLYEKLGQKSSLAHGATYFHSNPSSLSEVLSQASWIGKNKFLTGNLIRKLKSLILYSFPVSISIALYKSILNMLPFFLFFKIAYDLAVYKSVLGSFTKQLKSK